MSLILKVKKSLHPYTHYYNFETAWLASARPFRLYETRRLCRPLIAQNRAHLAFFPPIIVFFSTVEPLSKVIWLIAVLVELGSLIVESQPISYDYAWSSVPQVTFYFIFFATSDDHWWQASPLLGLPYVHCALSEPAPRSSPGPSCCLQWPSPS